MGIVSILTIMKIEQVINTTIYADKGKVFKKKSDGSVQGDVIPLGYDYYDADMPLSRGYLSTPDDYEEVDMPDWETFKVDQPHRLKRMLQVINETKAEINTYQLTNKEALEVKEMFPMWGVEIQSGTELKRGDMLQHIPEGTLESKLYRVLQDHSVKPTDCPCKETAHLYREVVADEEWVYEELSDTEEVVEETEEFDEYEIIS